MSKTNKKQARHKSNNKLNIPIWRRGKEKMVLDLIKKFLLLKAVMNN